MKYNKRSCHLIYRVFVKKYKFINTYSCGGLSMGCSVPKGPLKDTSTLSRGGLIPGTQYVIRVASAPGNRGTFKLCIRNFTTPLNPGADCDGAIRLCNMEKIFLPALSGGGKKKEIPQTSCLYSSLDAGTGVEANSSWYKWTCEKSGTLTFVIDPVDPKTTLISSCMSWLITWMPVAIKPF